MTYRILRIKLKISLANPQSSEQPLIGYLMHQSLISAKGKE